MRLIQSQTDYAARSIVFIAQSGLDIVSTAELESEINLPRPFLRKILQELQRQGVLESVKGNKGGFRLAKSTEKIYLMDLVNIFQGGLDLTECIFRKKICSRVRNCPIRSRVKEIEKLVVSKLDRVTIADLIKNPK